MVSHRVAEIRVEPIRQLAYASSDFVEVHILLVAIPLDDEHLGLELPVRHGEDKALKVSRFKLDRISGLGGKSEATQGDRGEQRGVVQALAVLFMLQP